MNQERPNIDDYEVPLGFFQDLVAWHKSETPHFSIRSLAEKSGYKTHSQLLKILKGQSKINEEIGYKLSKGLGFTDAEADKWIYMIRGDAITDVRVLPLSLASAPIDMLIISLMHAPGSQREAGWFSKVTKGLLSEGEVLEALTRLTHAKVAQWTEDQWTVDSAFSAARWGVSKDKKIEFNVHMNALLGRVIKHGTKHNQTDSTYLFLTTEKSKQLVKELRSVVLKYDNPARAEGDLYVVNLIMSNLTEQ